MRVPRLWLFEPTQQQASHVLPLPFQDPAQPLPSPLIVAKSLDLRASPQNRRAFGSAASRQGASPGTQVVARPSHDRRQEHARRPKENPRARQQEKTARRPTAIRQSACSFKNTICEQTNVVTLIRKRYSLPHEPGECEMARRRASYGFCGVTQIMSQLSEALGSAGVSGSIIRPLLVATILFGLWHALARSDLDSRKRLRAWTAVAAALILWLTVIWTLALQGRFVPEPTAPRVLQIVVVLVPMIVLIVSALTLLMRSQTIAAAVDAAPLWWLIAYQTYRVIGGVIFLPLWYYGILPGFFALPAGIGDTLTGLFAIVAVVALWRDAPLARPLAYAVNVFGMADLIYAISMGVTSTLTSTTAEVSPIVMYPLVMVPTFGVPLAFVVHCLSIWQLRRRGRVELNGQFALQKS